METVPGEADAWCASATIRGGGWAMSGDTDLLLYGHGGGDVDLEPKDKATGHWGVIMLRDFNLFKDKRSDGTVHLTAKALVFWPRLLNRILFGGEGLGVVPSQKVNSLKKNTTKKNPAKKRRKLKSEFTSLTQITSDASQVAPRKPTLQNLAYHLQNESTASMNRLKQMVKSSLSLHNMSQQEKVFINEYALVPPHRMGMQGMQYSGLGGDIQLKIRQLDPRFSELLYQLPCLATHVYPPYNFFIPAKKTGKESKVGWVEVNSFLPFLYEDPTRSGAWDVGREIRATVYGILEVYQNESNKKLDGGHQVNLIVKEYVRKGKRIREVILKSGEDWGAGGYDGLLNSILSPRLLNYVATWRIKRATLNSDMESRECCECIDFWWVEIVVEMVLRDYAERRKEMPVSSEVSMIVYMLSHAVTRDRRVGRVEVFAESKMVTTYYESDFQY